MQIVQWAIVIALVAASAVVTVRHLLRQFSVADTDFSGSAGCSSCPAAHAALTQTSIRGRSTRRRARIS